MFSHIQFGTVYRADRISNGRLVRLGDLSGQRIEQGIPSVHVWDYELEPTEARSRKKGGYVFTAKHAMQADPLIKRLRRLRELAYISAPNVGSFLREKEHGRLNNALRGEQERYQGVDVLTPERSGQLLNVLSTLAAEEFTDTVAEIREIVKSTRVKTVDIQG